MEISFHFHPNSYTKFCTWHTAVVACAKIVTIGRSATELQNLKCGQKIVSETGPWVHIIHMIETDIKEVQVTALNTFPINCWQCAAMTIGISITNVFKLFWPRVTFRKSYLKHVSFPVPVASHLKLNTDEYEVYLLEMLSSIFPFYILSAFLALSLYCLLSPYLYTALYIYTCMHTSSFQVTISLVGKESQFIVSTPKSVLLYFNTIAFDSTTSTQITQNSTSVLEA